MGHPLRRTIKSINIGVISQTATKGTHDVGYVFGIENSITSVAAGRILPVVGSTADVSEPWSLTLIVPDGMEFDRHSTVTTAAGGNVTGSHYSFAPDADGNHVITFIADAEDTGGAIANGEDVTVTWIAKDRTSEHATIFNVKCQSTVNTHSAQIKVRFLESGTLEEFKLFAGDSLVGPFSELEVDSISNASLTCMVFYQEH